MKTPTKKKYLFTSLVLSFLIIVITIVVNIGLPIIIKKKLTNIEINDYKIEIGHVRTSLLKRSITIKTLVFKGKPPKLVIKLSKVSLTGLNILSLLKRDSVIVDKIIIEAPEISVTKGMRLKTDEPQKKNWKEYAIPDFQINKFIVQKGKFLLKDAIPAEDSLLWMNFDASFTAIHFESDTAHSIAENFIIENININIQHLNYLIDSGNYVVSINNCKFQSLSQQLEITKPKLIPTISKYEIGNKKGAQTTWYNASAEKVLVSGVKLVQFIRQDTFSIRSICFDNINFEAFKDKRLPFPNKPDSKLFVDLLQWPKIPYNCDSIIIRNSNIRYSERVEKSKKPGYIDFNDLNIEMLYVTNRSAFYHASPKIHAEARVMNRAKLNADFKLPDPSDDYRTRVTGELRPMSFHHFNTVVEPNTGIHIESGDLLRLMFDFSYTNNYSVGNLILDYQNLKISLLDRTTKQSKDIKSLLANTLIVREKNLPEQRRYRNGKIYFVRDKKKSIINYWWKSVFSGIESIVVN